MVKNDLKITLYEVFVFQKLSFFFEKKESRSTQEEQGSKKGGKIVDSFVANYLYCKHRNMFYYIRRPLNLLTANYLAKTRSLVTNINTKLKVG